MTSLPFDRLCCPAPCGAPLTVRDLRVLDHGGFHGGAQATLECPKCNRQHPVCDAEHVETVRFKMLVALGLAVVLGVPCGYFGAQASDGTVSIATGIASLALVGWFAYALAVFVSARSRARRLASLIEQVPSARTA